MPSLRATWAAGLSLLLTAAPPFPAHAYAPMLPPKTFQQLMDETLRLYLDCFEPFVHEAVGGGSTEAAKIGTQLGSAAKVILGAAFSPEQKAQALLLLRSFLTSLVTGRSQYFEFSFGKQWPKQEIPLVRRPNWPGDDRNCGGRVREWVLLPTLEALRKGLRGGQVFDPIEEEDLVLLSQRVGTTTSLMEIFHKEFPSPPVLPSIVLAGSALLVYLAATEPRAAAGVVSQLFTTMATFAGEREMPISIDGLRCFAPPNDPDALEIQKEMFGSDLTTERMVGLYGTLLSKYLPLTGDGELAIRPRDTEVLRLYFAQRDLWDRFLELEEKAHRGSSEDEAREANFLSNLVNLRRPSARFPELAPYARGNFDAVIRAARSSCADQ